MYESNEPKELLEERMRSCAYFAYRDGLFGSISAACPQCWRGVITNNFRGTPPRPRELALCGDPSCPAGPIRERYFALSRAHDAAVSNRIFADFDRKWPSATAQDLLRRVDLWGLITGHAQLMGKKYGAGLVCPWCANGSPTEDSKGSSPYPLCHRDQKGRRVDCLAVLRPGPSGGVPSG